MSSRRDTLYVASADHGRVAVGALAGPLRRACEGAGWTGIRVWEAPVISKVSVKNPMPISRLPGVVREAGGELRVEDIPVAPARPTDPATSKAAAKGVVVRAGTQRMEVLRIVCGVTYLGSAYRPGLVGWTASEVDRATGMVPSSVSKRLGELERHGFLVVDGTRKSLRGPAQQQVYRATEKGLDAVEMEAL